MSLKLSVRKTISYFDYFHYPYLLENLTYWLNSPKKYTDSEVFHSLDPHQQKKLQKNQSANSQLQKISILKISKAKRIAHLLRIFPGLVFVGITGSVAANSAKPKDDIDLLVVTEKNCLWLVRPFLILFLSLFNKVRRRYDSNGEVCDFLCFNFWLDTSVLKTPPQNQTLYTAHEILQIIPIFEKKSFFGYFLRQNLWVNKYLRNAFDLVMAKNYLPMGDKSNFPQNSYLYYLNKLFFALQLRYMKKKQSFILTLNRAEFFSINYQKNTDQVLKLPLRS